LNICILQAVDLKFLEICLVGGAMTARSTAGMPVCSIKIAIFYAPARRALGRPGEDQGAQRRQHGERPPHRGTGRRAAAASYVRPVVMQSTGTASWQQMR
jgi:hypothetical protein